MPTLRIRSLFAGRLVLGLVVVLLGYSLSPATSNLVFAQTETAALSGVIQDPNGGIVPDVEVTVTRIETGTTVTTKTNGAGIYVFTSLMPGHYHLMVRKPGFKEITIKEFQLFVQDKLEQNFALEIGSVSESVTVNADDVHMNTTDASVSTLIDRQFVENLPLNGRSFNTLLQLTPGVVLSPEGFNVNGQRDNGNYYTVDGVSANLGVLNVVNAGTGPATTSFGGTNSLLSIDALQEFRIQTSTSGSDAGRTPGGQIEVTTRSGTNNFHGNVFDYFRNDALDANDWFYNKAIGTAPPGTISKPALHQNDFGGTLGGPIRKEKTFFFLSYEGLRLTQPQVQYLSVPNRDSSGNITVGGTLITIPSPVNQLVQAFPLPNGPDFGNGFAAFTQTYSAGQNLDVGSVRVDHVLTSRISLFGRASFASSSSAIPDYNYTAYTQYPTRFVTAGLNAELTPHLANQFRFNYSISKQTINNTLGNPSGAVAPNSSLLLPAPFNTTNGLAFFVLQSVDGANSAFYDDGPGGDYSFRQLNIVDNLSWNVNQHLLRFGIDYRRYNFQQSDNISIVNYLPTIPDLASGGTSTGYVMAVNSVGYVADNISLFLQDTWRIGPKLVLTPGLRWDINTGPTASDGKSFLIPQNVNDPANLTATPGKQLWKTSFTNFAPHIGVVFNPLSSNRIILRSGFGMFYDLGTANTGAQVLSYPFIRTGNNFGTFVTLPLDNPAQYVPPLTFSPPFNGFLNLTDPNLKSPYSLQWNFGASIGLSQHDVVNFTYVGQAGRRLLRNAQVPPSNPNFSQAFLNENASRSNYDALQVQYVRRLAHGLQVLGNYTYSHSLDDLSSSSTPQFPAELLPLTQQYGNSDFDIRHNFSAGVTYDLPGPFHKNILGKLLRGWGIDSIFYARTGFPIDVIEGDPTSQYIPLGESRPDRVLGQPFWVPDPTAPGGQQLNSKAFALRPANQQGNLPRNAVPGFGFTQWDTSFRRTFSPLENWKLVMRLDMFNMLNHPNFQNPSPFFNCGSPLTSQCVVSNPQSIGMLNQALPGLASIYQNGGPRSLQISLKLQF